MRILMIVPQPFFSPRGTPFSVYYRTRVLASLGHTVDVATYPLGRDVSIPGVSIHRIRPVPFIRQVKVGPSLPKLVLDWFLFWKTFGMLARGRYDVVHAHEEGVFFCLLYKLVFWRMKFVYDMHSSLPQQLRNFAFSKSRLLIGAFALLEKWAIRWSSAVITICPELQKTVEDLKVSTPSVMIENSLIDAIDYSDRGDEISDELINWEKFDGKRVVLYSGTFEHYQGIPMLLESAREVLARRPDAVFVLIGGASAQVLPMRALAEKLGVFGGVVFTGNLHPNAVKRFIRRADVLVSPRTRGNNTPLKIYEYLASGKPIVATRLGTHTQVLSEKEAVLAECEPHAFAEGILAALAHAEAPSEIGRQAADLYRRSYGREIYLARLQRVLQHVA